MTDIAIEFSYAFAAAWRRVAVAVSSNIASTGSIPTALGSGIFAIMFHHLFVQKYHLDQPEMLAAAQAYENSIAMSVIQQAIVIDVIDDPSFVIASDKYQSFMHF